MSFFKYIKAIGTGPKSNRDLTYEEAKEAIEIILENRCESEQAAAFLMLLRVKLESNDELKGSLEALNKYIKRVEIPESVELGFAFDGKTNQPYLFPLFGNILKSFFEKYNDIKPFDLVLSGDHLQPSKKGITVKDIATTVRLENNTHFFDREQYLNELSALTSLRKKLYMRTVFNTIEKLLNPAHSKYAITSSFHKPYVRKYLDIFSSSYENMLVIKGNEGTVEVFNNFKYWIEVEGEIEEKLLKLEDFGINYTKEYENITLEECLEVINNPSDEVIKLAKLNIAILLFTTRRVDTIEEAYSMLESC